MNVIRLINLPYFSLEEDKMNVSNNFPYSEVKYEIKYIFFFCHNLFQKWRFHIAAISIIGQLQFSAELSSKATQKSNSSQQDISCTLTLKTQRWNVIGSGCRYFILPPSSIAGCAVRVCRAERASADQSSFCVCY